METRVVCRLARQPGDIRRESGGERLPKNPRQCTRDESIRAGFGQLSRWDLDRGLALEPMSTSTLPYLWAHATRRRESLATLIQKNNDTVRLDTSHERDVVNTQDAPQHGQTPNDAVRVNRARGLSHHEDRRIGT